jgi:hypothetical protein
MNGRHMDHPAPQVRPPPVEIWWSSRRPGSSGTERTERLKAQKRNPAQDKDGGGTVHHRLQGLLKPLSPPAGGEQMKDSAPIRDRKKTIAPMTRCRKDAAGMQPDV